MICFFCSSLETISASICGPQDVTDSAKAGAHIATIPYRGTNYCVFQQAEPETEEDEDEVIIFALDEENQKLDIVEDEQTLDEVFAEFCRQYEDFEDADEAMRLDN